MNQWKSRSVWDSGRGCLVNGTHFASEWFEFVVEVAETSLNSSAKQGTLASPTTKVSTIGLTTLRKHCIHDFAMDVCQSEVAALIFVSQLLVIDSHQMQDCRIQIMHMDGIPNDIVAVIVSFPVSHATLDASPRHQDREAARIKRAIRGRWECSTPFGINE